MPLPEGEREQLERAAFWRVEGPYGLVYHPIDSRAVYGYLLIGGRDPERVGAGIPIRQAASDLKTAVRCMGERAEAHRPAGDRVRVNDGGWMEVLGPRVDGHHLPDEGFVARYENGEVVYVVEPYHGSDNPPGTFDSCWMYDSRDYSSAGAVECVEVDWNTEARPR